MTFQTAVSGLNNFAKALDATSNNLANSNTVGFKTSAAQFADVFAATLSSASARPAQLIGLGGKTNHIAQSFKQGEILRTGYSLDAAITGEGFFRLADADKNISYTRNGQFRLMPESLVNGTTVTAAQAATEPQYLLNGQGLQVTGYPAVYSAGNVAGSINTSGKPQAITVSPTMRGGATSQLGLNVNLDVSAQARVDAQGNQLALDPADNRTYNSATTVDVYDSNGNTHQLTLYFARTSGLRSWQMSAAVDGGTPGTPTTLSFDAAGKITTPNVTVTGNGISSVSMDLAGSTMYGGPFSKNKVTQDGFANGDATNVQFDKNGIINVTYSNGQVRKAGQLALARFENPDGLEHAGNNNWRETDLSGKEAVDVPNNVATTSKGMGAITGGSVEQANLDMNVELTNLIINQRNYQANAQSIKTQDQMLQSLASIR